MFSFEKYEVVFSGWTNIQNFAFQNSPNGGNSNALPTGRWQHAA